MIEVIVGFRDAVFAALVAWTGAAATDGDMLKAAKDKDKTHGKPAIEKPVEQPAARVY